MKQFLDDDFLLGSETARSLYRENAAPQPIIDYHCHLDPALIAADRPFRSITELWLGGDHYKWRAERANGVDERYITGDASDWEKFQKWAETVPYTFRNPLYHWTHMELRTAFGIDEPLNPESARRIYDECNARLADGLTPRALMRRYGVELVCTTDDPADSLEHHLAIARSGFETRVLPTWRPDRAMAVECPADYQAYMRRLGEVAGVDIRTLADLEDALRRRHDFFAEAGCRLSDHGLDRFYAEDFDRADAERIFAKVLGGEAPTARECAQFKTAMLLLFGRMDAEADWTQQFHYGAIRNNNTRMMRALGPDTGYDSIGEFTTATDCARLLDRLDLEGKLGRTIIYNLNPAANEMVATMIGNFQDGITPGKIQFGSGWWFNDQTDGMRRQMNALSLLGLLSRFVGMLTDSRSFLSYPRHDYFRRTLCDLVGADVEAGLIPFTGYEQQRVRDMIEDICYRNAKSYFKFS